MFMDIFPKVLKWCVSAFFLIWGIGFLVMVKQYDHMGPFILALFSFGIVYWQYKSRADIPKEVMLASLGVLVVAGLAALYLPEVRFPPFNFGFFGTWSGWALVIGVPVISWTYHEFD